jgi:hypothetical protein
MYRLSHLVAWLQTNFRGRVIWQQTTAVVPAWLDPGRQKTLVESKIRLVKHLSMYPSLSFG